MAWYQTSISLPKHKRGFHWITKHITKIQEIKKFKVGQMHLFMQDNDASITLCESWDQSVTVDMETIFNQIVPDSLNQQSAASHKGKTEQKGDDMDDDEEDEDGDGDNGLIGSGGKGKPKNDSIVPRAKSILIGNDITVPINNGSLTMGTWQGVWLCEHTHNAPSRKLIVTINGIRK